jgi:pimeloyl-ACP methyl ester carboxylesterase
LVTGALDEKFCELSRQVVDRCPQSSWLNIADVGHNPLLEAPAPVAEAIARHLRDD